MYNNQNFLYTYIWLDNLVLIIYIYVLRVAKRIYNYESHEKKTKKNNSRTIG